MRFGKVFLCDRLDGDGGTRILQKQVLPKGGLSLMSLYNNTRWWGWRHRYSWSCCFKQHVHTKRVKKTVGNWRDNGRGVVESRSFYLFVSALEYYGEGAMADQVFGVVLEVAYTFHREFLLCQSFDWRSTNAIELHQRWYDVEQPCTTSTRVVQLIITVALESSHCRLWQRSRKQFSMILIHTTNEILRIYCRQWQFKRH